MIAINKKTIITKSANQTKKFAALLAFVVASRRRSNLKNALIFALIGDLGSGKTTFIQGFGRALGIKKRITSPTFVIIRNYELGIMNYGYKRIYHIDCYRINNPKEILDLGFKEIIGNPQNIVLIEWADRIRRILSQNTTWINFYHSQKPNQRIIKINSKFKVQSLK